MTDTNCQLISEGIDCAKERKGIFFRGKHESFGFKEVGIYHNVGYKFGSWHDVKWYELKIKDHIEAPVEVKSIDEISNTNELKTIIEKAERMLK